MHILQTGSPPDFGKSDGRTNPLKSDISTLEVWFSVKRNCTWKSSMELESVIHDLQILPIWNNFESFIRPLRPFDSLPPVSSLFWQPMYRWISHCTSLVFAARSTFIFLGSDWHISYIICDFTACSNNIKAILSRCSARLSVIVEKDFSLYITCICDQKPQISAQRSRCTQ